MRATQFPLFTSKEVPADAEIVSHRLMLRAGLIRKLASGLYTWLPMGLRVLRKVEAIVREEMNAAGALEVSMPIVQPAELWQSSGRWEVMGDEMLRLQDRHTRNFCLGPTHEEVITDFVRGEYKSYKQLPVNFYQIQTKFRDERRPRFGIMRAREFLMKDAYSFHMDEADLEREYQNMRAAYTRIFTRLGADFRIVRADSGNIGGSASEEFHLLAQTGEDLLAVAGDFAANIEAAPAKAPDTQRPAATQVMQTVATPGQIACDVVAKATGVALDNSIKSIAVMAGEQPVLLLLRGDHEPNPTKIDKLEGMAGYRLAKPEELTQHFNTVAGYIGPVGMPENVEIIADHSAAVLADFLCGANQADAHLTGVNFGRDLPEPSRVADLRNVAAGEMAPNGQAYELLRGIEAGHIFQLGRKYSASMDLTVLDADGKAVTPTMGCYGIGVSRVVAATIEQCHDAAGICWPAAIAPFHVVLCPIGMDRSEAVREATEKLYQALLNAGVEVLLDDRGQRPGAMFADAELIGIPHRVVIGSKGLDRGVFEYRRRSAETATDIAASADAVLATVHSQLS